MTTAFDTLAQIVGQPSYLLGGTSGSLTNNYPECVDNVFPKAGVTPKAAMVIEADFVVSRSKPTPPTTPPAPSVRVARSARRARPPRRATTSSHSRPWQPTRRTPRPSRAPVTWRCCCAPPRRPRRSSSISAARRRGEIWAHLGGFASPNKMVSLSSYPDPVTRADAEELQTRRASCSASTTFRAPGSRSLWQDMLNFVKNPSPTEHRLRSKRPCNHRRRRALGH